MKPTWVWADLCLLLLNATIHLSQSSQNTETNSKDSNVVHMKAKVGCHLFWLFCTNESTNETTVWRKNGNLMPSKQVYFKQTSYYPLLCVHKSDEGNYTCHNTSKAGELHLGKIVLKVLEMTAEEEKDDHPCGKPNEVLVQKFLFCPKIPREKLPCCNTFGPPPKNVSLSIHFNKSYDVCKLYGSQDQPWTLNVSWNVPFYGGNDIWGWQIHLLGLQGDANFQQCVQINSKDKVNWTFSNVLPGATYAITVESLPSGHGHKGYTPNFGRKTISIPSWKEMCKTKGRKCKWQICMPVKNVTVTRQNTKAPVVSWRTSQFYKSPHDFLVNYRGKNCSDIGIKLVTNGTRVILNLHKCHAYFVRVMPIFSDSEFGTYSKEVLCYYPKPPSVKGSSPLLKQSNFKKILISSSIALSVIVPVLIIGLCIYKKRRNIDAPLILSDSVTGVKVFIGYNYNHCEHCNDVANFLGKVLQSTGNIDCSLDIWTTTKKIEMGCNWYAEELEKCDIILFICAGEDQKISNEYALIKNMIMGKEFRQNNVHLVTVGFDNHPEEEIPLIMQHRLHFRLPSQIDNLCYNINRGNFESFHDYKSAKYNMGRADTSNIEQLRIAIETAEKNHKGKKKATCVRYLPATSTSKNEFR